MQDQVTAIPTPYKRVPWNKGKVTGAKPPLRPKHVWSIRTKLQIEGQARNFAMFNLAEQVDAGQSGHALPDFHCPVCATIAHAAQQFRGGGTASSSAQGRAPALLRQWPTRRLGRRRRPAPRLGFLAVRCSPGPGAQQRKHDAELIAASTLLFIRLDCSLRG
jgi:hypothetical protein